MAKDATYLYYAGGGDLTYRLPAILSNGRGPGKDLPAVPQFRDERGDWQDSVYTPAELRQFGYTKYDDELAAADGHYH